MEKRNRCESGDDNRKTKLSKRDMNRDINWVYPFHRPHNTSITPPFISVGKGLDIQDLTLQLKLGAGLVFDSDGDLSVVGGSEFRVANPLFYRDGSLSLKYNQTLALTSQGELSALNAEPPLKQENNRIVLELGDGLSAVSGALCLLLDPIFRFDGVYSLQCAGPLHKSQDMLQIRAGNGVGVKNGQLECTLNFLPPLGRRGEDVIFTGGSGIGVVDGELRVQTLPPIVQGETGITLAISPPFKIEQNSLSIGTDQSLRIHENNIGVSCGAGMEILAGGIAVKSVAPLVSSTEGLKINTDTSLTLNNGNLAVNVDPNGPLEVTDFGLTVRANEALMMNLTNEFRSGDIMLNSGKKLPYKLMVSDRVVCLMLVNDPEITPISSLGSALVNTSRLVLEASDFDITVVRAGTLVAKLIADIRIGIASAPALVEFTTRQSVVRHHAILTIFNADADLYLLVQGTDTLTTEFLSMRIVSVPFFTSLM